MKYTQIKLSTLKTYEDCEEAICSITNDYQNYYGGLKRWNSGYITIPLKGAEKKIKAIENRMERLFDDEEVC